MDLLLFAIGFIGLIVGVILLLIAAIRKVPKKKAGMITGVSFVLFVAGISMTPVDETEQSNAPATALKQDSQQEAKKAEEQEAKEVTKKKEEEEKAAEEQRVAKEKVAAEKKAAEEELAKKKAEEQRLLAEKKAAEEKVTAEKAKGEKDKTDRLKKAGTASSLGAIGLTPVQLVKTIDGDTIKIVFEGKEQNVRYLLIDTPETNHPRIGKQPFGEEAKERNRALVNGGKLEIEFDIGQRTDKYGRLLAYVYVDGKSVNETLVEEGLARVAYVYPPNTRHLDPYEKAQVRAKAKKIGIWSVENYATHSGFNGGKSTTPSSGSSNSGSSGSGGSSNTTPPPATNSAPASGGTEFFQNCTELRKKYPNGVPKGHPAYQAKMDRDKDDFACER
ncbi:thermonuclease family protein [Sporosarcina sp. A2]|uniref:thermonuclease family protein n=1 Tax=Sporosarcina sp. A2 TaxID=3393449 RepID=UPI003D7BA687